MRLVFVSLPRWIATLALGLVLSAPALAQQSPALPDVGPLPAPERAPTPPAAPDQPAPKAPDQVPPGAQSPPADPSARARIAAERKAIAERKTWSLDQLFGALKAAKSREEGEQIETEIESRWLQSGSDTVDLLMARALKAMTADQPGLALDLLDMIVMLKPDYSEAWTRRAIVHYSRKEFSLAIEDVERALALEPRQFNALTGLANILEAIEEKKAALSIHRRILELHPTNANSRKEVEQMAVTVEGRPS
jgi:tetratricopeptide (TPR) repeat protein